MLTQWLCPERLAAFAVPWDTSMTTTAEIERVGVEMAMKDGLNLRCGICGQSVAPEHGRTRFATLKEALPVLTELIRANVTSRVLLDELGLTVEKLDP